MSIIAMVAKSRRKGSRIERETVNTFLAAGFDAKRVPLSGAARGFKSDIHLDLNGEIWPIECKARAKGFALIYKWLTGSRALVLRADRSEPLVTLRLVDFCALLANRKPAGDDILPDAVVKVQAGKTAPATLGQP